MKKADLIWGFILFLVGISSRIPFIEKIQSHWDGPQYSIAILRYSLSQETPAPPGYPLYIFMGKLLFFIFRDPFYSLLMLSVIFSGIGTLVFYLAGKTMFNRAVGILSAAFYISGSSFYYFGLTAYAYGLIPPIITVLALVVYCILQKGKKIGLILGIIFSFLIGVRPQEIFAALPLFILGCLYLSNKERVLAVTGFLLAFSAWFFPFLFLVGGIGKYIQESYLFANTGALPSFSFDRISILFPRIIRGLFLSFGIGCLFLFYYLKYLKIFINKKRFLRELIFNKNFQLYFIWIVPSVFFNLFIRSDHAGYQITFLSACVLLIAYATWKIFENKRRYLFITAFLIIVFNLWWFFRDRDPGNKHPYVPTSFHYSEIRKNDLKLGSKINFIKKNFDPHSSLIITSPDPWRPLMYHLYSYLIYDVDGLVTKNKRFAQIVRKSQYWSFEQYKNINYVITIPSNVRTLIFTDDNADTWIKGIEKKVYKLSGNSKITTIDIKNKNTFTYKVGLFKEYEE